MEKIRIAVDAMGGDFAPAAQVEGAVEALRANNDISVTLYGDEAKIQEELKRLGFSGGSLAIVNCTEAIEMAESPVTAIQKKKDSSIVKGMQAVRKGEADAFVSAGNTGAVLVGGQVVVGRIKGVQRPPLGVLVPTTNGMSLLVDCGANVDARPSWLLQFAEMGSIYYENVMGVKNPKVGILNIGAEEEKGNSLVKDTFPLLRDSASINFIGSVEARDVINGSADVIVCDAFAGNVFIKTFEGVAGTLLKELKTVFYSSLKTKLGAVMITKELKEALRKYDVSNYGGAPLLGLKGLVVKAHGNSTAVEFKNTIEQCIEFRKLDINEKIRERIDAQADKLKELRKQELKKD